MKFSKKMIVYGMVALCLGITACTSSMQAMENVADKNDVVETIEVKKIKEEVLEEAQVQGVNTILLELEGGTQDINIVEVSEQGSNVRKFRLEAHIGGRWQSIYTNDLIEGYHMCVLENTVTTDAIRLVVEEEAAPVTITSMSARYLESVKRDKPFTSTAYLSKNYYEHDWDEIDSNNFASLTDIIMIGNFSFNNKGEFIVIEHDASGLDTTPHEWNSEYAKANFPVWKEKITKQLDTNANVWVSITCYKNEPNGAPNGQTDVFHDPKIREKFLCDLVKFAKEYNIAGYDIDWEYPGTASQWQDYNNLILEAAKLFEGNGIMLSSAQATGSGLSLESLNVLDRINIMAYDNYATTKNHSTFYNSAVKIVKEFKNKGISPDKLILGLPYYGVKVDSYFEQWDYKHIYNQMVDANEYDPGCNLYGGWGFNGPNLIRDKVVYAIEQEIGGVFCWQMKNDIKDFSSRDSLAGTTSRTIERFIAE